MDLPSVDADRRKRYRSGWGEKLDKQGGVARYLFDDERQGNYDDVNVMGEFPWSTDDIVDD